MRLPDPVRNGLTRLLERDAAARGEQSPALPEVSPPSQKHPLPARLALWLNEATGQMRWKRARPYAADELAGHLTDQYEAFRDQGMDEAHAAEATIREMGDAVETGTALDRAWRPAPDWVMLGLVLGVAIIGKIVQYLIAGVGVYPVAANESKVQILQYLAGAVCLFAGYFLDYTWLGRHPRLTYAIWAGIMAAAFWRSPIMNGKWYYPEYGLWLFPVAFATVLYSQRGKGRQAYALA
ncbi:permease prefix domain 1-containing protein [Agathobaculum sp. NTUH-O15-33]|uniref:permease prefix domain 1-containing protein n=1 Tax=Agathobaculum sp. NTUH-O15-33 TaxID=3079302 RepID=UPI0029589428|nr:permease prefix domain 1-containing protein [Agathobaculum sp. NTUH-O15-33]WNX84169.1 permease prefix domain 1-containing protein [Agathobaculum sp. NTUH-O15-33]